MEFFGLDLVKIIAALIIASTPLIFAAIGELVTEKSGVLNLGVEGMMIIGAIGGFIVAVNTGSPFLGMIGGGVSGLLLALIFAILTQFFLANQVASGLALTLTGLGLSALLGKNYNGIKPPKTEALDIPLLSDIPLLGDMFFSHDLYVYIAIGFVVFVYVMLKYARFGLKLRSVGENHDAAHSLGINVIGIRFIAILFGGFCAGLGGAYISLIRVPQWTEGMTAGLGWIALALVVFGSWRPFRVMAGAYLFGGVTILQLNLQGIGVNIQPEILAMMPYIATIVVLVAMSARASKSIDAPASLGQIFRRGNG